MRLRWVLILALGFLASQAMRAAAPSLDRTLADLKKGDGLAAEQDILIARRSGLPEAQTRHLLAHAYLLQGDANRALREADSAQIPSNFQLYASKIRIKADLARNDVRAAASELSTWLVRAPNDGDLWSELARTRARDGDLAGAILAAQKSVALSPKSVDALLLTASLTRDQQGLRAALPWFQRALRVDPNNIAALLELAATQGDSGQARAMLATTRRVLSISPNNPQAFYLQAVMAMRADKPELARDLLYHCSPALDHLPGYILLHGIVEMQSDNPEQALSAIKLLVEAQPQNIRARRLLGAIYAQSGDAYATIETLRAIADRPDADSYTLVTLARAYENVDDRAAAARYLDRAAKPSRGDATPFDPNESITLLARNDSDTPNNADNAVPFIQGLMLTNHYDDALGKAQNLATLNPGVPLAHILVGDAQMALKHYHLAVAEYRRAAAITLTEPIVMRLVNALDHDNDPRGAAESLATFLDQNPTNLAALNLAASLDIQAGRWASAAARLENVRARLGNSDANLLNNLAWCWFNLGKPTRALPYARAAYALQPANAAISNAYGWLLFETGQDQPAGIALMEKAVSVAPDRPILRLQLASAYQAQGRTAAVRKLLAPLAARLDLPESAAARQLLLKL